MEVIDHQRRVGQQLGGADRRGVDRGRVDRDVLDGLAEGRGSLGKPVDHRGAGAALALAQ
ncbi:Uncharacterised protein [Mycobacteroides abscessus subsp. abscessus]|nr:hypothetical protein CKJ58_11030 [Mycobacterium intracellulare subsp. chimaera]PBA55399.1 hypothetical protein CKJ57_12195 [Mycobacterium intracellulare subsp. chimaera]SKU66796.1 Uncharacterised protein [Mycobacteroides abscessus subsp. abscessus]